MDAGDAPKMSSRAFPVAGGRCSCPPAARAGAAGRQRAGGPAAHALVLAMVLASTPAAAQPADAPTPGETRGAPDLNEVDRFMEQVFDNRRASWRRLGDFILRETIAVEFEAPLEIPFSGLRHEYAWYVRDGVAVRRPVQFNGVDIGEERRRDYEEEWLREEERRRAGPDREDVEPRFMADAYYFTEFPFEPGSYYFAGRETVAGAEVVRIEYYPTSHVDRGVDERLARGFNKTSLVTYWVDPDVHQIVKYTFDNPGLDFLRFRWLVRVDGVESSTDMTLVGDVRVPGRVRMTGRATTARGEYEVTITREFFDYREAETGARLIDGGSLP